MFTKFSYFLNKDLKKFENAMKTYLNQRNITEITLSNFLNAYDNSSYAPENYQLLFLAPKYYLACSKQFKKYYDELDYDFRYDLMDELTYQKLIANVFIDNTLYKFLNKKLKNDFIFN